VTVTGVAVEDAEIERAKRLTTRERPRRVDGAQELAGVLYLTHEWRHDPAVPRRQLTDFALS
jgi:hypothetical protein